MTLNVYLNPKGSTTQVLTRELIEILVRRGDVLTEKEIRKSQAQTLKTKERIDIPTEF